MKLKEYLKGLFNRVKEYVLNHKQRSAIIAGLSLITIMLCIIVFGVTLGERKSATAKNDINSTQQIVESLKDNAIVKETDYLTICSSYNEIADLYNRQVDRYNSFIEKLVPYNLSSTPPKIEPMEHIIPQYDAFDKRKDGLVTIVDEMNKAQEIYETLQTIYPGLYAVLLNEEIDEFNQITQAFNDLMTQTSVDFIANFPAKMFVRDLYDHELDCTESEFFEKLDKQSADNMKVLSDYMILSQITNPSEEWVLAKLDSVKDIVYRKAVTSEHDPNGLLGKDGGYTSCVYFNVTSIDKESVKGADIVEKGTAVGGAIEVYPTLESAKNRCEYLSQFDGTLLYSGSYAIIGTMVVRTSYRLDNQEQIDLTNAIVEAFTSIK